MNIYNLINCGFLITFNASNNLSFTVANFFWAHFNIPLCAVPDKKGTECAIKSVNASFI